MSRQSRLAVDLVAFDMGGTTVRDDGVVPHAFRLALEPLGVVPSPEDVHAVRGASKRAAIASLLTRARGAKEAATAVEDVYRRFNELLQEAYGSGPLEPVAGASELFAWLRERGARVALTTGFGCATRDTILRRLGWDRGVVDAVVSAEEVAAGRPAPYMLFRAMELTGAYAVDRLAAVGDTALDLEAGTNAGARFVIGVLGGAHDLATLGRARHTHILPALADLPHVLGGSIGQ